MARYVDTKQGKDDVSDMEMLYNECIIRYGYQNRSELATLYKEQRDRLSTALKEDVAPVVHAHWKEFEDYSGAVYPECSRCGLVWWLDEGTAEDNEMYYCPKCGAKMDE